MAAGKILCVQQVPIINKYVKCWDVCQKQCYSKKIKEAALKELGLPERPKRPTVFGSFNADIRPSVTKQNPGISFGEISKIVASKWQELPESQKAKYEKDFEKKLAKYKIDLEEYNKQLQKQNVREVLDAICSAQKEKEYIRLLKEEERVLNKPKHIVCPMNLFLKDINKKTPVGLKEGAEKWNNLSESEKERYNKQFKKEREQYVENLKKWEDEMIQQGNLEMVRLGTLKEKLKEYF